MVVPLLRLGRFTEVERCLGDAARQLDAGDDHNRTRIAVFRGVLLRERGDPARALTAHTACLQAFLGAGVTADAAMTLIELGEDLLRLGRDAEAATHLERAVGHAVKLVDPSLERAARNVLGRALTASGDPETAIAHHERAAALAESHEDTYELARAHHGLADAHHRQGQPTKARRHRRQAAQAYTTCGVPEATTITEPLTRSRVPMPTPS